jgi:hypothetical protein
MLEEYVRNYDPKDGSNVVRGRILGIDEVALSRVLYLPMGEMAAGSEVSVDFQPKNYFKSGDRALEKNQG